MTLETARSAILGYTIGNDVSARDLQKSDELWISAKSQDTFTPVGPWIVTDLDDSNLEIGIVHNGHALRTAGTADLGWKVDEIMVYLTSFMTLQAGDLVLSGFPRRVRANPAWRHRSVPCGRNRRAPQPCNRRFLGRVARTVCQA